MKKMNKIKKGILLLLVTCYLLLVASQVEAKSLSLSVDPPIITINAIPPATTTNSITIQNKGEAQVILQIQMNPFKANLENGELEYLNSQDYSQIFQNVKIMDGQTPIDSLTLGPKQQKNLTLNVTIPQDTTISDYYFSIIFISQNSSSAESNASLSQVGLATNVLLSVGQKETPKAFLEKFSSDLFFEKGPVPFTIRVKNQGTHFIKPKGEIIIKNMFGQRIGKLDLISVNILSDSTRAIPNTTYMEELKEATLDPKSKTSDFKNPKALWNENFLLGLYEANLSLSLSDEGPIFTKSIRFFAFPFQFLIVIIAILIAAIFVGRRVRKYMNKDRT